MKTLRNFLIANLCAVMPLWWALFGWMPDQVRIYMRGTEAPGSIVASGTALVGEDLGEWKGGRIFRFYLRKDMQWKTLAFRLPGSSGTAGVERIELQKWKLLSFQKSGEELVPSDDGLNEYVVRSRSLGRMGVAGGKIPKGLAFLELVLLCISWWFARRHRSERWKTLLGPVVGVGGALTLLMQVALPVQSYLANKSSYPFSASEFCGDIAMRFAWTFVLAVTAVGLLTRCFGRRVLCGTLAIVVCIYMESGFLSIGLPSLDGSWWVFQNPPRAIWDGLAWLVAFALLFALHPVLKRRYGLASCVFDVLVIASMFDAKREEKANPANWVVDDFSPCKTVIQSVRYSPNRNILVFILDSLEREHAHAIMNDPDDGQRLQQHFKGFTEYVDNVGALPQTLLAVPNLLTGNYPGPEQSMADYCWSVYSEESALKNYLESDYEVFITTPALGCGYASWQNKDSQALDGRKQTVLDTWGHGAQIWPLSDVCRWRSLPFCAKATYAYFMGLEGESFQEAREWIVYPQMQQVAISPDSCGTFVLLHTEGVHAPVSYNRKGELSPREASFDQACVEQGIFLLDNLGNLLDAYRNVGIYDNSLILVMGDHGRHGTGEALREASVGNLPRNARPCLWIKPVNSKHEFSVSQLPTSHAKVAELLKLSSKDNLSEEQIQGVLQADKRIYRRMALFGGGWKEWMVNRDGTFLFSEVDTSMPRKGKPLKCGKRYSLSANNVSRSAVDLFFTNVEVIGYPTLKVQESWMQIHFQVPDATKRYVLKLETKDEEQGTLLVQCATAGGNWESFSTGGTKTISVTNIVPDDIGRVTVDLQRGTDTRSDVTFTSLWLLEEM